MRLGTVSLHRLSLRLLYVPLPVLSAAHRQCLRDLYPCRGRDPSVTSGSPSTLERAADSGNLITTAFCSGCGSAIYSANSARPRLRTVYVGTLDQASEVKVDAHIWTKRRLPWVSLPTGHRIFTEAGDWRPDYARDPSRLRG